MNRRMNGTTRPVAVVLAFVAMTTSVQAQRQTSGRRTATKSAAQVSVVDGRAPGFVLGVHTIAATGVTVTGVDVDGALKTGFGPGAGVMVGYGFNRTFSAFASLDVAKQTADAGTFTGSFGLTHFEVGGRANLPMGDEATVPYVSASLGHRSLSAYVTDWTDESDYQLSLSGGMFGIGGGVQHAFSPALSLDSGLEIGFGRFGHVNADGQQGGANVNGSTTVRLRVGVNWRPMVRRST